MRGVAEWEDIIGYPTFERLQAPFGAPLVRDHEGLRLIRPGTGRARVSTERLLDSETTIPQAVEELAAQKFGAIPPTQ